MPSWLSGANFQKALLGAYTLICIIYLSEKNYGKALYWFGALIITFSVLVMK